MEIRVLCYHQPSYHNWRHIEFIFKFVSPVFISAEETDDTRSATSSPDTAIRVGSAVLQLCIMQTYFMTGPGVRTKITSIIRLTRCTLSQIYFILEQHSYLLTYLLHGAESFLRS